MSRIKHIPDKGLSRKYLVQALFMNSGHVPIYCEIPLRFQATPV